MPEELTPSQAALRLGSTTRSVQRWIAAGRLPARRVGGRWRVATDAIDALLAPSSGARPIQTLFVANRGEIANRISRTARGLGIAVVVPLVDGPEGLDLLDPGAVVTAARGAGADALHPGFGFLAESAEFAAAVTAAGIRWVGPPPEAIRAMGDKAAARRLATEIGVPLLPGYDESDQAEDALVAAADGIGFPLVVKPAAGGGGKGMRVVREPASLVEALDGARREALAAFGDDRLVLERYLDGPRHVEIQILFDGHGNGVHLGERDCSIQRRHQKVLEETPSPDLDAPIRRRMADAALALARAVGYVSAGTCEFLVDDRGGCYFLEMNTRLQVEHPVTELVTGRDLVADQLRIAAGEPLGFGQADVRPSGHAIEARLYAEDAEAGFLPATGRIEALRWPGGEGVRVDAGIELGDEVGGRFDPMLAKIVAHGPDRGMALARLTDALDETAVLGLVTNLRFLRWLVRQPVVVAGEARIDTLERVWPPDDRDARTAIPAGTWAAAAGALAASTGSDPWSGGWRLNAPRTVRLAADGEERLVPVDLGRPGEPALVRVGDVVHVDVGGRSVSMTLAPPPDVDRAARLAGRGQASGSAELSAPMPGRVLAIHAALGDTVTAGQPVVTLEAMKMEHIVPAPVDGRLGELLVAPGDQVARGQSLGTVEP